MHQDTLPGVMCQVHHSMSHSRNAAGGINCTRITVYITKQNALLYLSRKLLQLIA